MTLPAADQQDRADAFRALHHATEPFVIPNVWDAGTARLLTQLGFPALATTSAGLAFALGRRDGADLVSRDETLQNAHDIVTATHLPVSADLESGFGDSPEQVAETIRLAAAKGLAGGSIEDSTASPEAPIHPFAIAVERVTAAVEAAKNLPFGFVVTARAENFLHGRPDLSDTIRRLQAFEAAGADVLFAPGLPDLDTIRAVCAAVSRPVNVLAAGPVLRFTVEQLGEAGVRRISLGSGLARAALTAALHSAQTIRTEGRFDILVDGFTHAEINARMAASLPTA